MMDVLESYQERKAQIGRAAMESCALEKYAESDCWSHGGWKDKMMMCRTESRAFNRCYAMQAKFLKALGYLSWEGRTAEEEERIQMHADKLYHEMLDREKVIEEAKVSGKPIPSFKPLIGEQARKVFVEGETPIFEIREEDIQKRVEKPLAKMTPAEREIEIKAIKAELEDQYRTNLAVGDIRNPERLSKDAKQKKLEEKFGPWLAKWMSW